jgi:hypothetical protein
MSLPKSIGKKPCGYEFRVSAPPTSTLVFFLHDVGRFSCRFFQANLGSPGRDATIGRKRFWVAFWEQLRLDGKGSWTQGDSPAFLAMLAFPRSTISRSHRCCA